MLHVALDEALLEVVGLFLDVVEEVEFFAGSVFYATSAFEVQKEKEREGITLWNLLTCYGTLLQRWLGIRGGSQIASIRFLLFGLRDMSWCLLRLCILGRT